MTTEIDFYFDFASPYTYLAYTALPRLAAEHAASIRHHPFGLLDLMKTVGNRPTTLECAAKGAYAMADLQRWTKIRQVNFAPNPYWTSIDFAELGRGALVALDEGRGADYIDAIFSALWEQSLDLSQRPTLVGVLDAVGFDGAQLLEKAGAPGYIAKYEKSTARAAERGVFGSPTMFVGAEMFFGNDRLDFVAEALRTDAKAA